MKICRVDPQHAVRQAHEADVLRTRLVSALTTQQGAKVPEVSEIDTSETLQPSPVVSRVIINDTPLDGAVVMAAMFVGP